MRIDTLYSKLTDFLHLQYGEIYKGGGTVLFKKNPKMDFGPGIRRAACASDPASAPAEGHPDYTTIRR